MVKTAPPLRSLAELGNVSALPPRDMRHADRQRVVALLAAAYGRTISPDVLKHIEGASEQWRRGDKALANIRLAFARLPRLEDRGSIARLFHAEDLLERGVSPCLDARLRLRPRGR